MRKGELIPRRWCGRKGVGGRERLPCGTVAKWSEEASCSLEAEATMSRALSKDVPESMQEGPRNSDEEEAEAVAAGPLPLIEADAFLLPAMESEARRETEGWEKG